MLTVSSLNTAGAGVSERRFTEPDNRYLQPNSGITGQGRWPISGQPEVGFRLKPTGTFERRPISGELEVGFCSVPHRTSGRRSISGAPEMDFRLCSSESGPSSSGFHHPAKPDAGHASLFCESFEQEMDYSENSDEESHYIDPNETYKQDLHSRTLPMRLTLSRLPTGKTTQSRKSLRSQIQCRIA